MKITCDIINDLLPSYVDGVCSEDSCKLVEEHLHDCARCSQKLKYMKNPIKCPEIQTTEKNRKSVYQNKTKKSYKTYCCCYHYQLCCQRRHVCYPGSRNPS